MKIYNSNILLIVLFVVLYSIFIFFVEFQLDFDVATEMIVSSVFFFALFSGFFIARQNDRYTEIIKTISERDGLYSSLYRIFGMVPRIQGEIRKSLQKYYRKIINKNNWAYNEFNPSTTITDITDSMKSLTKEEGEKIENYNCFDGIWDVIVQLQQNRKKIIALYNERLLPFQWMLIYIFTAISMISFHFIQTDHFLVNLLKIFFGIAVLLVTLLIRQLNDLAVFGENFSNRIADDVLWVIEERDKEAIGILEKDLKEKIEKTKKEIEQENNKE